MFTNLEKNLQKSIAYFSMEFGLRDEMKTFSGGLGILAGDTIKTAADMGLNFVGVTLLYKNGWFKQELSPKGEQLENPDNWNYEQFLENTGKLVEVKLNSESIFAEILKYTVNGVTGKNTVLYFLNANIEQNSEENRKIGDNLYTPDENIRFRQEVLLGIGGVYALKELGYEVFDNYHLNESHAAFGILGLKEITNSIEETNKRIVFTTHTPEKGGHKIYPLDYLKQFFNEDRMALLSDQTENNTLHTTKFCCRHAKYTNAVAKRHQVVTAEMFPEFKIDYITNGIHVSSWAGNGNIKLFDKLVPDWKTNPENLKHFMTIDTKEILESGAQNKKELIDFINTQYSLNFSENIFTIGFARRVVPYKRWDFILSDIERLKAIAEKYDGIQIIMSGKAYFDHLASEAKIREVFDFEKKDSGKLKVTFLPNYGMKISKMLVSGCDIWLNNPIKLREASGTSGMKAALNGIPNFSTIDGWWVEGHREGLTGWSIGTPSILPDDENLEKKELYNKLENVILPLFKNREEWAKLMRTSIAYNGSYFNTHRMLREYLQKAYI